MSRFIILLGGDLIRTPYLDAQIAGSRVIAVDSGICHAAALRLVPELWLGDFDSVPKKLENAYPDVPREVFPTEKDKTDGELAVETALARGATHLILAGAFGGPRADHAFLHLSLAVKLAESGVSIALTSGAQEGHPLLSGRSSFDYEDGTIVSVVGFTALSGMTLDGVKWPLNTIDVPFGSSLTISNEVRGGLRVELKSGRAVLIAHPFPGSDF